MRQQRSPLVSIYADDSLKIPKYIWYLHLRGQYPPEEMIGVAVKFIEKYKLEDFCTAPSLVVLSDGRKYVAIGCSRKTAYYLSRMPGVIRLDCISEIPQPVKK